jgi:hypothetical protein
MESMKAVHWLAIGATWMCFVIGAGLLACGYGFYHHTRSFLAGCTHADGTVVENIVGHSASDDSTMYYPEFSFQTPDGEAHTMVSSSGSSPASYKVGQHVPVVYTPGDLTSAKVDSFSELWFAATVFFVLGAAGCIGGIFWLLVDRLYVVPRMPKKAV